MFQEVPRDLEGRITPTCFDNIRINKGDEIRITKKGGEVLEALYFRVRDTQAMQGGILEYLPKDKWDPDKPKGLNYFLAEAEKVEYRPKQSNGS